ncbi:rho GTPase-activating protein 2 [Panicum miliaceum]|uniref:Rho GTPase-activating protein 2 n=1 Tax=Panicum miliaceum TaxID=4540 RepID=A0A3L6RH17_PANMI|nr:rho GTPase-activating protein 2 [Panicum miliaceum]
MTGVVVVSSAGCKGGAGKRSSGAGGGEEERRRRAAVLELLLAAVRRSVVACRVERGAAGGGAGWAAAEGVEDAAVELGEMEIGWPTDVLHVAHVTFDRFHGFLGLPVEFEDEMPCRVPSASASVFGVSAESMQCTYDGKGNSVPTILLLMQERLYSQGGLKAEGIFRINPENDQEEQVRDQLNKGVVPEDIDVHCLASLIKAWFRELPEGVLDGLSPEQVLQCNSEGEFLELVTLLCPTQAALLNWAVELMSDVVEAEELNKMNARNIAMVFAPNMTQRASSRSQISKSGRHADYLVRYNTCFDSEQEMSEVEEGFLRRLEHDIEADIPEESAREQREMNSHVTAMEDVELKTEDHAVNKGLQKEEGLESMA